MTIDRRRRAIEIFYNIIKSFTKESLMQIDETLVNSAQIIHNSEHLFGPSADLYTKASQLSALKGVKLSPYQCVLAMICITEAKIASNAKALTQYSEIAGLYAILASLAPPEADPEEQRLDALEADLIKEMAAKLAPEMPKAEPMFGSPNGA